MKKSKILKTTLFIISLILPILIFKNAKGQTIMYFLGFLSLIMLAIQILSFLRQDTEQYLVDKDEATTYYKHWLEKHRKTTIPQDAEEYFSDETETLYRFVFMWLDEGDGHKVYAPIEIFKYYVKNKEGDLIIQLGHGRGKITKNMDLVQGFILKDLKATEQNNFIKIVHEVADNYLNNKLSGEESKSQEGLV